VSRAERLHAVGGFDHVKAVVLEVHANEPDHPGLVVDDEDAVTFFVGGHGLSIGDE